MNEKDAIIILQSYWDSIRDIRPSGIFLSLKLLPCTIGRLKYAHFVLGEVIIIDGEMDKETQEHLTESFGLINSIFIEDPESENKEYKDYLDNLKNGKITNFLHPNPFGESKDVLEYYNFLGESLLKHTKEKIPDVTLESFIYGSLTNEAIAKNDVKTLINLANTSLTRAVSFPDKKENEDCVFF
jgi:hypothetical protein